ncbi:pyridoxamine 5'-phosphate oxidase family protein [Microbacterium sp. RU33B]|uniref:pyridoxamine 5'-phosphate oxidase family protein n=1 Tax=Microbacterium sp. RU33B TaxID=1907390 RepID=UPI00095C7F05|nr:pyridoxamine 5'-phosphate oxidase family protein [Microbacterium sp. RU33B]SIT69377.1 Pyridoxamine 5'-phosphate oxidase [Microbacterium sp. RU33B]
MNDTSDPVTVLTSQQCWEALGRQELGRLVTRVGNVLDVFPVNYIVDERSVLFRTAPGSKLFELTVSDEVLFEVDDHSDVDAWSVVVRGHAHALTSSADVERADTLALAPWIPTLKYTYVRIVPAAVSGRRFVRGPEPDRYGIQSY